MKLPVVLNTRPREQAAQLTELLQAGGFVVVEAPAIATVAAWASSDLERVCLELARGAYAWVVLASQNAGRALVDGLGNARVVCGEATAQALGIKASIRLERFSANAALEALLPRLSGGDRVLVPRAAEGREELLHGLVVAGASVDAPVAYRTVGVPDAADRLRGGGIDVVTLCSPSAVRSVVNAIFPRTTVVCLGATTAEAARQAGLRVDAVAADTTMRALVDAVRLATGKATV